MKSSIHNIITWVFFLFIFFISCKSRIKDFSIDKKTSGDSLKIEKIIPLPGVKGRIDHLEIDDSSKILYVAALRNNSIEVIDLKAGSVVKSIKDIEEPQYIILLKEKKIFCVSSGGSGECRFYDTKNYSLVKNLKIGSDADNMRYDDGKKLLYVGYGEGAIAEVDIENLSLISSVKLSGHPESFQIDKSRNRIYVNVPDSKSIEVIDLEKNSVIDSWVLKDASSNFPMSFDEKDNLLFIGCRNPWIILVYDITSGKEINRFDIKGDVDDIFFDPEKKVLFVSCGEGFLQIFKEESWNKWILINEVPTSKGARTGILDKEKSYFYVAEPNKGDIQDQIVVYKIDY